MTKIDRSTSDECKLNIQENILNINNVYLIKCYKSYRIYLLIKKKKISKMC